MNEGLIARRYAKALYDFALEKDVSREIYDEMKLFERNSIAHPDLHKALSNPALTPEQKEMLLVTATGIDVGEVYVKFVRLLIKNHREMYMRSICLLYQRIYREANGIVRVRVLTATDMPAEMQEKIKAFVKRQVEKPLEFVFEVEPSILGGFIIQMGARQLDASLRRELKDISLKFLGQDLENVN